MSFLGLPYSITRSITINGAPQKIFDAVRDFHEWGKWSPWLCTERTAEVTISGDGKSVGDIYAWKGKLVGEGEVEHKEIEEGKSIKQELRFTSPFRSVSQIRFLFEPSENAAKVTWEIDGRLPVFLFFLEKMMVTMLGNDFERGLQMLKDFVETGKVEFEMEYIGVVDVPETHFVGIRRAETMADMKQSMEELFPKLMNILKDKNIAAAGAPFCLYHKFDMSAHHTDYTVAIPVATGTMLEAEGVYSGVRPTIKAFKAIHTGAYKYLGSSWMGAYSNVYKTKGLKVNKSIPPIEMYVTDPQTLPPEQWKTEIYIPVK